MTPRAPRGALRLLAAAFLLMGSLVAPAPAAAQKANLTLAPADVVFPSPTDVDFLAGWVDYGGVSVTVAPRNKKKQDWQLFLQTSAADMGGYGKPVQDILVRVQGSSSWIPLTTTAQLIAEGTGTTTVTVYYRLLLDLTVDDPGSYAVPLEYSSTTF